MQGSTYPKHLLNPCTDRSNPFPRPSPPQKSTLPPRVPTRPRRFHLSSSQVRRRSHGRALSIIHKRLKIVTSTFSHRVQAPTSRSPLEIHASQNRSPRFHDGQTRSNNGCFHGFRWLRNNSHNLVRNILLPPQKPFHYAPSPRRTR